MAELVDFKLLTRPKAESEILASYHRGEGRRIGGAETDHNINHSVHPGTPPPVLFRSGLGIVSAVLYALLTIQHTHHHHYTSSTARQGAALSQHKLGLAWNLRNTSDNLKHFWPNHRSPLGSVIGLVIPTTAIPSVIPPSLQ